MGIGLLAQVLLARQMEQSVKDFAAWRKNREHEVAQLRRQGRKQAAQVRLCPPDARACPVHPHCISFPLHISFLCQLLHDSKGGKGAWIVCSCGPGLLLWGSDYTEE